MDTSSVGRPIGPVLNNDDDQVPSGDRLSRAVHLALAIYLAPVVLVVIALGGVMLCVMGAIRVVGLLSRGLLQQGRQRVEVFTCRNVYRGLTTNLADRGGHVSRPMVSRGGRAARSGDGPRN